MTGPMTARRRWAIVALGIALVVAAPFVVRAWPAPARDIGAGELLARVRAAGDETTYSGFVESLGRLQLPVASRFTGVGDLFGEQNRLRVWWRGPDAWRVDRLVADGEQDLIHGRGQTTAYDFDDAEAVTSNDPAIRLPRSADLLPPVLAARLLRDAGATERLDTRRVAGVVAAGLRVRPAGDGSSIDHLDLWADPDTGLVVRLEVYGASGGPALTSRFLDLDQQTPPAERVAFTPTATTDSSFDDVLDIADAADQYAPIAPPDTAGGLRRTNTDDGGAVGVYGTGMTQLVAIPLRGREAGPLRDQVALTPGSVRLEGDAGSPPAVVAAVGPLGVLVSGEGRDGGFLVTGTVTPATLEAVVADLYTGSRYTGGRG